VAAFLESFRRRGLRYGRPCPTFTTEDYGIAVSLLKKYSYRIPWKEGAVGDRGSKWAATIIMGAQQRRYVYGDTREAAICNRVAAMHDQPTYLEELVEEFWLQGAAPFVDGYPFALRLLASALPDIIAVVGATLCPAPV